MTRLASPAAWDEEEAERESPQASAPHFDLTLPVNGRKALRGFFHGGERFGDRIRNSSPRPDDRASYHPWVSAMSASASGRTIRRGVTAPG